MLQMFGTWTCSYADILAPVPSDLMSLDGQPERDFFEAPIGGFTCDDELYGFPQEFNIEYGATLVNTDDRRGRRRRPDGGLGHLGRVQGRCQGDDRDERTARSPAPATTSPPADGMAFTFFSLLLQAGGQFLADDGHRLHDRHAGGPGGGRADAVDRGRGHRRPRAVQRHRELGRRLLLRGTCAMGLVGPWVVPDYEADFPEVAAATHVRAAADARRHARRSWPTRGGASRCRGQPGGERRLGLHRVRDARRRERAARGTWRPARLPATAERTARGRRSRS